MKPKILGVGSDNNYLSNKEINAINKAFGPKNAISGDEILKRNVKVIHGLDINPDEYYTESPYAYPNGKMPLERIIEYPDGTQHTLTPYKEKGLNENKIKITESDLNHIISESIKKALSNLNEGKKKKVVNDKGEEVPEVCTCGAKVGVYICGEPIYKCSKCGKYYGTVPFTLNKTKKKKTQD